MGCAGTKDVDSPKRGRHRSAHATAPSTAEDDDFGNVGFSDVMGHAGGDVQRRRRLPRQTTAQTESSRRKLENHKAAEAAKAASPTQHTRRASTSSSSSSEDEKEASPVVREAPREQSPPEADSHVSTEEGSSPSAERAADRTAGRTTGNALTMLPVGQKAQGAELRHEESDAALSMLRGGLQVSGSMSFGSGATPSTGIRPRPTEGPKGVQAGVVRTQPRRQFFFMEE